MMDKETKSVQGTEGRSIRNKLEFSGRTVWYQGCKKLGSGTEGGSIGQIPKDWVQRTTLIELDQEKKSEFRGRNVGRGFDTKD